MNRLEIFSQLAIPANSRILYYIIDGLGDTLVGKKIGLKILNFQNRCLGHFKIHPNFKSSSYRNRL